MSRQTKFACQTQAVAAAAILAVQFFALQSDNAHAQMRGAAAQTSAVTGSKAAAKPIAGTAPAAPATCTAPAELARFDRPLIHTMRRVADATYPSRLAVELRTRFPGRDITVLNRGVNGEETNNMMARFAADVLAAHPQLVLWQIGTNSVLRD